MSAAEDAILRSLRRITRAIDLHSRWLASNFGLTIPQLVSLRTLAATKAMTPSELARAVDLSQATITGIIDRLVRRDLVTRERSTTDRRRVVLTITDPGRQLLEASPSPLQERFATRLSKLPKENQQVIRTVLEQVVRPGLPVERADQAAPPSAPRAAGPPGPPGAAACGAVCRPGESPSWPPRSW